MSTLRSKRIKYDEGQWFAVPLNQGGYALGVVARGSYRNKIALGYFFGRKFQQLPTEDDTADFQPSDAILIRKFGDLGIVEGTWPLIQSSRFFHRHDWPVPKFARIDALNPDNGVLVEYDQERSDMTRPVTETPSPAKDLIGLPIDSMSGSSALVAKLSHLLDDCRTE